MRGFRHDVFEATADHIHLPPVRKYVRGFVARVWRSFVNKAVSLEFSDDTYAFEHAVFEAISGGEITVLAVMTGSVVFLADLIRRMPVRLRLEAAHLRSYPGRATRSRGVEIASALPSDLAGRDVLIVDDILDTGRTLALLRSHVVSAGAKSVRTCVLLRKRREDLAPEASAELVGFEVADRFVVGYGLDFDGLYRNLPDICVLRDGVGEDAP